MSPVRLTSLAIASLSVIALTGCALGVEVESGSGIGTCEGKGDLSISTTQNEAGDEFTIDYYGPSDVSLAVVQGFYSENNFYELVPTRLIGIGTDEFDDSVNVSVLTDGDGWTTTSTIAGIHSEYEGTVSGFVDSLSHPAAGGISNDDPTTNLVMPFVVGVSCDADLEGGVYTSSTIGEQTNPFENVPIATDFGFAAAQPVFPNHVLSGPLQILSQAPMTNGIEGTFTLPEGTAELIGDFTFNDGIEFPLSIQLVSDIEEIPNNNMSDIWLQLVAGSGGPTGSTFYYLDVMEPYSLTEPMVFNVVDDTTGEIAEGNYLVFIGLDGFDDQDAPKRKVLFASASYSAADGLEVTGIDVPLSGEVEETPALSETGLGTDALVLGGFGLALVVAGVTAVVARRRRS